MFGFGVRVLETRLDVAECARRLEAKTVGWTTGLFPARGKPLRGRVSDRAFSLRRYSFTMFENLYHPVAIGHMSPSQNGTRVELRFRTGWAGRAFLALWTGVTLALGIFQGLRPDPTREVPGWTASSALEAMVGPLTLGVVVLAGFVLGRFIARHEPDAMTETLTEILEATAGEPGPANA